MVVDGCFVVVWQSGIVFGEKSVCVCVYCFDGLVFGQEFQVNMMFFNLGGSFLNLVFKVDMVLNGDFVVVWESEMIIGNDNDSFSVQGQCFLWDGVKCGGQFQLNIQIVWQQKLLNVVMSVDGSFIVGWIDWQDCKVKVCWYVVNGVVQGLVYVFGGCVLFIDMLVIVMVVQGYSFVVWMDGQLVGLDQDDILI